MKKTYKALLVAAMMVFASMTASFAIERAEEVDMEAAKAAFGDTIVNVKYGAANVTDIILEMENSVRSQDTHSIISTIKRSKTPTDFKQDGGMECLLTFTDGTTKTVIVSYKIIAPTLKFKTDLGAIKATDSQNRTKTTLLAYVNTSLELVADSNTDYGRAIGAAPAYVAASFTWNAAEYYAKGGLTYSFTQVFMGKNLTRSVTVNAVSTKAPSVDINYDDGTVTTTSDLKYSLDRRTWSTCSDNMTIPDKWQGERVYFYRPASTYVDESSISYIDIPYRADAPTSKLVLTTTSHSITVTNVWDYDDPQFSLDGTTWKSTSKSTFVFEGLSANTRYTVYVREGGSSNQLASKSLTTVVTTGKKIVTGVDITTHKNGKTQIVTAVATVEPEISSKTLSGSLSADDLGKLKLVVKEAYDNKYTVLTDLLIEQLIEENESKEIASTKFTIPMSALTDIIKYSSTTISVNTPVANLYLDQQAVLDLKAKGSSSTLTINTSKVTALTGSGSRYNFLKQCLEDDAPVFEITVANGSSTAGEIRYYLPYELGAKERLDSLTVYHVDEKGAQTDMNALYNNTKHALVFTTAKTGYFVVMQDSNSSPTMSFTDMRGHWAYNYVAYCHTSGIFNGVSSYAFAPDMEISRGMIVTLLARLDGSDGRVNPIPSAFTDVKGNEWFASSVQWAYKNGIINKQGAQFGPNASMSREEIACVLANYLDYKGLLPDTTRPAGYDDSKNISSWAVSSVDALAEMGVMTGVNGNKFAPNGTMTRAEMATIMYRLSILT